MDDLLDLSWSDSKGQNGGGESGSTSSKTGSSFDLLSRPTPNANYFSSSGKSTPLQPALGTVSASPLNPASSVPTRNGSSAVTPARTQSPAAGDAFSSLLGVSSGGGKQNLTMAEKQAELAAQRAADAEADKARWGNGDFWNKLEGGGVSGSIVAPTPQNAKSQQLPKALQPELRDTSRPASAAPSPAPVQKDGKAGTFWDSHNLLAPASKSESRASTPASRPTSAKPAGEFGWDDDDDLLGGPAVKPAAKQKAQPNAQPQSWDDDLLGSGSKPSSKSTADPWDLDALSSAVPESRDAYGGDSDDDLLGELGRPAESSRRNNPPAPQPPARNGASPPPHIIGQIVEMGFPPDQARRALAATASGEDVQAALETLLASRGNTPAPRQQQPEPDEDEYDRLQRERKARHAARRAGPSRDSVQPRTEQERERDAEGFDTDRIVAQASELGANMLSKATSFWNTGKERAMKVYEEQKRALDAQQSAARRNPPTDGRPRWMVEAEAAERGEPLPSAAEFGEDSLGFQDDHSGDEMGGNAVPKQQPVRAKQASRPETGGTQRVAARPVAARPVAARPVAARPQAAAPPRAALTQRTIVDATPKQLTTAAEHKSAGNDHFKLGRFAEAEVSYSIGLASLPNGHIQRVPLLNNRAATRLKLGHALPAVEDCSAVIEIVGPNYHPAKEAAIPDLDVKLGDALVKATAKRAQAYEMAEKWNESLLDWQKVLGYDPALGGSRSGASDGVRRAKAMVGGQGSGAPRPKTQAKPKPKPKPVVPADVRSSKAVAELRKAAQAAEKEDEERIALKDSVDARLEAWKKGKEGNLRALLASLDTVLWDGVVVKVGMHELVTEKQVKIKYMKIIARLHPDKLAASKVTVEQKMLANGVFGTLSEAWQAFQA